MSIQWLPSGLDLNPSDWLDNFENNITTVDGQAQNSVSGAVAAAKDATVQATKEALQPLIDALPNKSTVVGSGLFIVIVLLLVLFILGKVDAL